MEAVLTALERVDGDLSEDQARSDPRWQPWNSKRRKATSGLDENRRAVGPNYL